MFVGANLNERFAFGDRYDVAGHADSNTAIW